MALPLKPDMAIAATGLSKKKKRSMSLVRVVSFGLAGLLVVGIIVLSVGIYAFHWESSFMGGISRAVPFPALSVNGTWKSYHDYLEAVDTLDYSLGQPSVLQASGFTKKPTPKELRIMVIDRIAKEEIVRQLAAKQSVTVTKADVDAEVKKLTDQYGKPADVEAQIRQLYRWDLATFRVKVIEPFLLRQRLQDKIGSDATLNAERASAAQAILGRLKDGKEDFAAVAKEVNEDSTKSNDGNLGVIGKGELDEALETAAFAMKPGDLSDVIKTADGYHILKLIEKIPADEKSGVEEKVNLAHIFISVKPLDEWLYEQSKASKVTIFLRGYAWDKEQARVIDKDSATTAGNANATP